MDNQRITTGNERKVAPGGGRREGTVNCFLVLTAL